MTPEHERLRQLVLGFEETTGAEREAAERHLATCDECRRLLERFQAHERAPGPRGALSEAALAERPPAGSDELAAAEASLASLQARLREAKPATPEGGARVVALPPRSRGRRVLWLVPAAAAAATLLALWFVPRGERHDALRGASLLHAGTLRGDTADAAPDSLWRIGDAFEVALQLDAPGWPVLVHVDGDGAPTQLYPGESADGPRLEAGLQVLRPLDRQVEWAFEGEPAAEEFLVAVATLEPPDRIAITRGLQRIAVWPAGPAARLGAVRALLAKRVGPPSTFRVRPQR
jgi:hypothetical protein